MGNLFDTSNAPTTEPVDVIIGNYLSFKRADLSTDYPVANYALQYQARNGAGNKITWTAADDGDGDYLVEVESSATASYKPGVYHWDAFIIRNSDSNRIQVDSGTFTVYANKATSSADPRSFNARMVDKIKTAIEHRADYQQLDVLAYDLGVDASATRDTAKLLKFLTTFEARLRRENNRNSARKGRGGGATRRVRF